MDEQKNDKTGKRAKSRAGTSAETPADTSSDTPVEPPPETPAERRRRRAAFLRELTEARELRARVQPRRVKTERMRQAVRMRTFRI
ncbi:hypothetical protein ABIA33_003718 [Streptacidiphilus sp. MAP12-16]|uniref:hypothetical protein n=1 Tax=Streptacidiphilus sp. MAP12-16 TaxID=3156300 RepID=UPI0035160F2B